MAQNVTTTDLSENNERRRGFESSSPVSTQEIPDSIVNPHATSKLMIMMDDDVLDSTELMMQLTGGESSEETLRSYCERQHNLMFSKGELLNHLHILEEDQLNPLHISILSHFLRVSSHSVEFIDKLTFHPRTRHTVNELFPNGLSPLDVARMLELHDIAVIMERAGGRPGMWADLLLIEEIEDKTSNIVKSLKELSIGGLGEVETSRILSMLRYLHANNGSEAKKILEERPSHSLIQKHILPSLKHKEKWKKAGDVLEVDEDILDKIYEEATDDDDAYYSMFKHWLKHGHNVTWETLLDAVGHFETKKTVDHITDKVVGELAPSQEKTEIDKTYNKPTKPPYSVHNQEFERDPTLTEGKLVQLVEKIVDAKWEVFATHLRVERNVREAIHSQCHCHGTRCFSEMTSRWLSGEDGTGDLPRTWDTVFDALNLMGYPFLVEDVKEALSEEPLTSGDISEETQSGPSWMTQYKKAIERQGSVSLNIIRCVLVGPPKVGKSCLKHLLVHNEPKEVTTSTPLLESPKVVTFTPELYMTNQGSLSVWQPIKDMGGIVKKWTMEEQYETQETQPTTGMNQDESGSRPHLPQKCTSTGKVSDDFKPTTLKTTVTGPVSSQERLTALQEAHEQLQKDLEKGNVAHALDQGELTLIHILDSGGQPAFQDTLPLLIGTPCTYITVFNASVDLSQPVDITYRAQDGSEAKLDHQLSQWDMMLRTFSSVHTMEYKCHEGIRQILQDGSTLPHSRIAVVGTHKDQLETLPNRDDLKKKMTTFLEGIEESKPYRVLQDQCCNPYFLIDNLQGVDQDYINSLRKTLSSEECLLPLRVPLMWLMVELTTQRMDRKFIPYTELKLFCIQEGHINKDDADAQFHSLLKLLHNLGFYAFYNLEGVSEADNWVCTDAATLYREVSKLLVVQYKDTHTKKGTPSFRKTGIIEDTNAAKHFSEVEIDPEIDPRWFLRVLHHIGIAAKVALERCQQFFIPLVLPFNRTALPRKTSVSQLCFTLVFSDQLGLFCKQYECDLPQGIFPYLAVHLVDQHHKSSSNKMWKIDPYHSDRKHIVFDCQAFAIYLIEQAGHMELAILLAEEFFSSSMGLEEMQSKLHSLCRDIHQTVTTAINSTCEQMFGRQFAGRAKVQSGFLCPCGEGGPHLAFLKSTESAQCSIRKTRLSRKLSSQEKIWFSPVESGVKFSLFEDVLDKFWIMEEISGNRPSSDDKCSATSQHGPNTGTGSHPPTLKSKPNESEMLDHLGKDMSADWEMFAVHLNIDPGVREQVKEDCHRISKRCLLQVVHRWLQGEEGTGVLPRTWSSVVSAVEKCGYGDLAARLRDVYLQLSSTT